MNGLSKIMLNYYAIKLGIVKRKTIKGRQDYVRQAVSRFNAKWKGQGSLNVRFINDGDIELTSINSYGHIVEVKIFPVRAVL